MKIKKIAVAIIFVATFIFIVTTVAFLGILSNQSYSENTRKHCEQYKVIPEDKVDMIPSGCVPYYYGYEGYKND